MSKHNYYRHLNRIVRYQPATSTCVPGIDQTVKTVKFNDLRTLVGVKMAAEEMFYDQIESRNQWKAVSTRTVLSIAMEQHPTMRRMRNIEKYTCPINFESIYYKQPHEKCHNSLDDLWRKRQSHKPVTLRNSIIGYKGGDEFRVLEDNGKETPFQLGNHCGILFNPDRNYQMIIMAKDSTPERSRIFIKGAQETPVMSGDSVPSPYGHILAGNCSLGHHEYHANNGAMVAMMSRHSNMLYTDFGQDYQCLVSRNGEIIYQTQAANFNRHKGCVRVKRGDVVFIGSIKCFNVVRAEEIARWSGFLCGRHSIAQFCQAAVAETTVRIGEIIRERLFSGSADTNYQPNMVCSVGIIT